MEWWLYYGPFATTTTECPRLQEAANEQLYFEKIWAVDEQQYHDASWQCAEAIESITCECAE